MRRLRLAVAVVLFGCSVQQARKPTGTIVVVDPCITMCGLQSWDFDCKLLQEAETRALVAFPKYVRSWDRASACRAFKGWDIRKHEIFTPQDKAFCSDGAWWIGSTDPHRACAIGMTHISSMSVELGSDPDSPWPLIHELGHVLDYELSSHIGHCRWTQRGIRRAITEATGVKEQRSLEFEREDCKTERELQK